MACALLSVLASTSAARELTLEVEQLVHPSFVARDLRLTLDAGNEAASVRIGTLDVAGRRLRGLRLDCPAFHLTEETLSCRGGRLHAPGLPAGAALSLAADPQQRTGTLRLTLAAGETVALEALAGGRLRADFRGLDAARLRGLLPQLAEWQPAGRLNGYAEYTPADGGQGSLALALKAGGFATADGLHAAEGVGATMAASARKRAGGWDWQADLKWSAGEAYFHPLYLVAGSRLQAAGQLVGERLSVTQATLQTEGVRTIAAAGEYDLAAGVLRAAGLTVADADLAVVGPQYLAPLLTPAQAERLRFAGHASGGLRIEEGRVVGIDAGFDEAGFSLAGGELSFGPLSGSLLWRADSLTEAMLTVAGGRWEKLALGSFELAARLHGTQVEIPRLRIPLLDGALVFDKLELRRGEEGWSGAGSLVVEPLSVPLLTAALGLPEMAGVLSAALPGLRVSPGEIVLDGTLVVSVFDGYLQVTELRLLEPFGVAAYLYADIDARHIDLAQLTDTFSFGSVTGYVDASVGGLELVRWRPVRFDARVRSSPGSYPRRISQRAVQNISALGGAGAVAAIQRSMLGFFESFGYREIGLSCVLADGICLMGGLADGSPAGGFALVRGGGIPALNVIGYNRRVDWQELIDRLQRVIESNAPPVVR
ncbi:hypothetical protein E6O51_02610 [Pseudothauera rhizosphaerae]|uniref:Dicarboxylate transport n=1 Tax=Pseudothauera rhizosphaerae TaxID=2565932 RepID=A0A4S4AWM9_9RHOO|nr:hypothetical protein E6O51_02610 [Pseudothauera rhizosphaerae]